MTTRENIEKEWREKHWFPFIKENPTKAWCWESISKNENVTFNMIMDNPDLPWDPMCVSMNPNISLSIVNDNPHYPWNYYILSGNPGIDISDLMNLPEEKRKLSTREFPYDDDDTDISNIRVWYVRKLSENPTLTIDFVKSNMNLDWSWDNISANPAISCDDIEKNPELPWVWVVQGNLGIISNPGLTNEFIIKYRHKWTNSIKMDVISSNPNIDIQTLMALGVSLCSWNWNNLSMNPGIHPEDMLSTIGKYGYYWQICYIAQNPNLTSEFIDSHTDSIFWKWRNSQLSANPSNNITEYLTSKYNVNTGYMNLINCPGLANNTNLSWNERSSFHDKLKIMNPVGNANTYYYEMLSKNKLFGWKETFVKDYLNQSK